MKVIEQKEEEPRPGKRQEATAQEAQTRLNITEQKENEPTSYEVVVQEAQVNLGVIVQKGKERLSSKRHEATAQEVQDF